MNTTHSSTLKKCTKETCMLDVNAYSLLVCNIVIVVGEIRNHRT